MSMEGRYVVTVGNGVTTMSMEGRYVVTVGNSVTTMSMEGRYVVTVGVITVFRNANSLAFRRYHAFASGEGRKLVATMSSLL
jgi:F0F1-type ATP synthase assembly protein I